MTEIERMQENIKLLRSSLGWTGKDLAAKLGVSAQLISHIETNRQYMSKMMYLAISKLVYDEIELYEDETHMAKFIMRYIVEESSLLDSDDEKEQALTLIRLLAPACLKTGMRRKRVSDAFILAMKKYGLSDLLGEL